MPPHPPSSNDPPERVMFAVPPDTIVVTPEPGAVAGAYEVDETPKLLPDKLEFN